MAASPESTTRHSTVDGLLGWEQDVLVWDQHLKRRARKLQSIQDECDDLQQESNSLNIYIHKIAREKAELKQRCQALEREHDGLLQRSTAHEMNLKAKYEQAAMIAYKGTEMLSLDIAGEDEEEPITEGRDNGGKEMQSTGKAASDDQAVGSTDQDGLDV
ncbi:hypothetical protein LTR53_007315 [Teratosphaeriaceae sp. CCFEE 6253]|nr:hypothetical protein LTR53_007315 [Teratosphaeriaceae sp. CCFEE 6253]